MTAAHQLSLPVLGGPDAKWRDLAPRLGYLVERLPCPKFDPASAVGRLLAQGGFIARRRDNGVHVLFADVKAAARSDLTPLEERYGLRVFAYYGLRDSLATNLLEITLVDTTRARSLFKTRRHDGPVHAAKPAVFFSTTQGTAP